MSASSLDKARPALLASAAAGVAINRLLIRAGLRRRPDGWRRAAGLVLRGPASSFVLSAFGLDLWSDSPRPASPSPAASEAHLKERLAGQLHAEKACHVRVRRGEFEDRPAPADRPSYTLDFEPWLPGPRRFLWPDAWSGEDAAPEGGADGLLPLFNIIARIGPEGFCDLWMRVNHVGIDGVPAQEILSRLEAAWGVRERVLYPTPEEFAPLAIVRPWPGRSGLGMVQAFLDFGPLLAWRSRENSRLPEPMTLAAALQWRLGQHAPFLSRHFGSTVEVAPAGGLPPGVGVVVVRPSDHAKRADGLAAFVRDFNRQVELNRARASAGCKTLDAAACLGPTPAATLLRHALKNSPSAFGSIALTVLKQAKVFGAPIADIGHDHGFLALGSVALPTRDGRAVGCITVKGPSRAIADYPAHIRDALESD